VILIQIYAESSFGFLDYLTAIFENEFQICEVITTQLLLSIESCLFAVIGQAQIGKPFVFLGNITGILTRYRHQLLHQLNRNSVDMDKTGFGQENVHLITATGNPGKLSFNGMLHELILIDKFLDGIEGLGNSIDQVTAYEYGLMSTESKGLASSCQKQFNHALDFIGVLFHGYKIVIRI
jgi:hypothetical protein